MPKTQNDTQPQALNHTRTGKALEEQAREEGRKRRVKQEEFARGDKRYTEGK